MGTCRTEAQLETLFHDNSAGDISAGDGRDLIQTCFGFRLNRDPGLNDDRVNTAGTGQFFDYGSSWLNTVSRRWFRCISGNPGAAIWEAFAFDGETMGGRLNGMFPNPGLAPTGVIPGVYGDAGHYAVFAVAADGTLQAAGQFPISGGTPARPVKQIGANYNTIPADEGFLIRASISGITIFCTTGVGFPNGWVAFFETVIQSGAIHFTSAGQKFVGGGYAWANAASPGVALTSFDILGAYHWSLVSDGALLHVCGLPVCADPRFGNDGPTAVPDDGAMHFLNLFPDPDGKMGVFGQTLCLPFQPVNPSINIQAAMIGMYDVEFMVTVDWNFTGIGSRGLAEIDAGIETPFGDEEDAMLIDTPLASPLGTRTFYCRTRVYLNQGDIVSCWLRATSTLGGPLTVTARNASFYLRFLGT